MPSDTLRRRVQFILTAEECRALDLYAKRAMIFPKRQNRNQIAKAILLRAISPVRKGHSE